MPSREHYLFVCNNIRPEGSGRPSCGGSGGADIYALLKAELNKQGLAKTVARVCTSSCLDLCDEGPVVLLEPENIVFRGVTPESVSDVIQSLRGVLPGVAAATIQPGSVTSNKDR